jgi:hypothetical protein
MEIAARKFTENLAIFAVLLGIIVMENAAPMENRRGTCCPFQQNWWKYLLCGNHLQQQHVAPKDQNCPMEIAAKETIRNLERYLL